MRVVWFAKIDPVERRADMSLKDIPDVTLTRPRHVLKYVLVTLQETSDPDSAQKTMLYGDLVLRHRHIVDFLSKVCKLNIVKTHGGGFIKIDVGQMHVYLWDHGGDYGFVDCAIAIPLLRRAYPEYEIVEKAPPDHDTTNDI